MSKSCLAATIVWTASLALACTGSAWSAEPDCVSQTDVDVARIDASVILVGEVHGTREIPRFVSALVCSLLRAGRPVILGVEHAGEQQAALNRYLASSGDAAARADLLQGINWKTYSDGRGSQAMFELVDALRDLRRQGQPVAIVALDRNENIEVVREDLLSPVSPADNAALNQIANEAMAGSVLYAMHVFRPYVVVSLAGYKHTSTVPVTNDPTFLTYRPMGRIVAEKIQVFTIGFDSGGGDHSGPGPGGSRSYALKPGILYEPGTRIDAMVHIDHLTASPLARDPAADDTRNPRPSETGHH